MGTVDIIIIIIVGIIEVLAVISPVFLAHGIIKSYDEDNKVSIERRGMKKHYFKFNFLEKPNILCDYNFKLYDTDYVWYMYEDIYNSRKNQRINIYVKSSTKVGAWLDWNEWGEYKTKHLSFRKLKKYIKENLSNLLKDHVFVEVAEDKYGNTYIVD